LISNDQQSIIQNERAAVRDLRELLAAVLLLDAAVLEVPVNN